MKYVEIPAFMARLRRRPEAARALLAHNVKGVEGDYRRGDALKKRRRLMAAWSDYCGGGAPERKAVSIAVARV
jgi:hypothetical protein